MENNIVASPLADSDDSLDFVSMIKHSLSSTSMTATSITSSSASGDFGGAIGRRTSCSGPNHDGSSQAFWQSSVGVSTPRPTDSAERKPKFLDRESFLARQQSDRFCIMNLLDPRTFQDDDDKEGSCEIDFFLQDSKELENPRGIQAPNGHASFRDSAAEFPSVYDKSSREGIGAELVHEVHRSLSRLTNNDDLAFDFDIADVKVSSDQGEVRKKSKKEKKERKEKKDKKESKKKKKSKKQAKQSRSPNPDRRLTEPSRCLTDVQDDERTTTSLHSGDLMSCQREVKECAALDSVNAFSLSMPNIEQSMVTKKSNRFKSSRGNKEYPSSDHFQHDGLDSERWKPFAKSVNSGVSDRVLIKVKTSKVDASDFGECFTESNWSDDENNSDSVWDSDSSEFIVKQQPPTIDSVSLDATSHSFTHAKSLLEPQHAPLPRHYSLDDRNGHSSLSATMNLEPASLLTQRPALTMPTSLGPDPDSPTSLASNSSFGTGMSTSVASFSHQGNKDGSQLPNFKQRRTSKSEETVTTVDTSGRSDIPPSMGLSIYSDQVLHRVSPSTITHGKNKCDVTSVEREKTRKRHSFADVKGPDLEPKSPGRSFSLHGTSSLVRNGLIALAKGRHRSKKDQQR